MRRWKKGYPNLKKKSEKPKILLTLRQKQLVNSSNWMTVFNEVHNSHLLSTAVGQVTIRTHDKKKIYKQKSKERDR